MNEDELMSMIKASMQKTNEPKTKQRSASVAFSSAPTAKPRTSSKYSFAAFGSALATTVTNAPEHTGYWRTKVDDDEADRIVPSKRAARRACSTRKMQPSDRVFRTTGPGSSRSTMIDFLRASEAKETGCIVLEPKEAEKLRAHMKSTTDRSIGNVIGGNVIVDLNKNSGKS